MSNLIILVVQILCNRLCDIHSELFTKEGEGVGLVKDGRRGSGRRSGYYIVKTKIFLNQLYF